MRSDIYNSKYIYLLQSIEHSLNSIIRLFITLATIILFLFGIAIIVTAMIGVLVGLDLLELFQYLYCL